MRSEGERREREEESGHLERSRLWRTTRLSNFWALFARFFYSISWRRRWPMFSISEEFQGGFFLIKKEPPTACSRALFPTSRVPDNITKAKLCKAPFSLDETLIKCHARVSAQAYFHFRWASMAFSVALWTPWPDRVVPGKVGAVELCAASWRLREAVGEQ